MCLRLSWIYTELVKSGKQNKLLDVNRARSLDCSFSKCLMVLGDIGTKGVVNSLKINQSEFFLPIIC